MHPKLKSSVISNPFEFIFFRFQRSGLSNRDIATLEAAQKDAVGLFQCEKYHSTLLQTSEFYIDRYGSIPTWAWKWFERLAHKIQNQDMKNYLVALTTHDKS